MRTPDVETEHGRAWNMAGLVAKNSSKELVEEGEENAVIAAWLVDVPWAHPGWDYHAITAIHLRPTIGRKPSYKFYPNAEYELMIASVDPDTQPDPDVGLFSYLAPIDIILQFHGVEDDFVKGMIESAVGCVLRQEISPDGDHFSCWRDAVHLAVLEEVKVMGLKTTRDTVN